MLLVGLGTAAVVAIIVAVVLHPDRVRADDQKRQRIDELYAEYRASFPDVPEMTVEQLLAGRTTDDLVLVDVREPAEQEVSMIPGAIPVRQFEAEGKRHEAKRIVVYCTIGYRSGLYARKLNELGQRIFNLKGGILAWAHAGGAVVDLNGQTNRVHVYGREWNLLPCGYEAVW